MRKHAFAAFVAVFSFPFIAPPAAAQAGPGAGQRTLACTRNGGNCDVSCATGEKTVLFVYDRVRSVIISEHAGNHALLEIVRGNPDETMTVLIGNIAYCTFNGLRDPGRRPAG